MKNDNQPEKNISEVWKQLSDESWEVQVVCGSEVDFNQLPKSLSFPDRGMFYIWGWHPKQQIAFFRSNKPFFIPTAWYNETFRTEDELMTAVKTLM